MKIRSPRIVDKVWGREEIIVDNGKYAGKRLILNRGYRCSIHSHEKTETFYIDSGSVYLELESDQGIMESSLLRSGDVVDISSNRNHRFSGLVDSIILEFSTPDCESIRETQSEEIPNFENWRKEILARFV